MASPRDGRGLVRVLPVTRFTWGRKLRRGTQPVPTGRPRVEGRENLGSLSGPAVFVANHASHLDTPLILGALPRPLASRLAVGAAADYFFT
jgi:1-acyl-sn-glycerol-3-phosphate acyltransferase